MCIEPGRTKFRLGSSFSENIVERDSMQDCLDNLRTTAEEQFRRLKKEIDGIKGRGSIRRISSGSELLGFGGILAENVPEKWAEVDKTLETLKTTLNAVYKCVDDVVYSFCGWQLELGFQEELEAIVIQNSLKSLQVEFESKLWEQRAQFCGSQSINRLPMINELSLRQERDAIYRYLSNPNPTSLQEGIGKQEDFKDTKLMTTESSQIKHRTKDELVNYIKYEMSEMKRNHESIVHDLTEECFILKREFLKEKGSSSSLRKDKEFDILRKKIPDVILKLDDILMENEKSPACCKDSKSLSILKDRLDTLLSENRQLKDLLTDKGEEVDCLLSRFSNAAQKMSHHSFAELYLLKQIRRLKSVIEDANTGKEAIEDSYMESINKQEICGIIFKEAIKDTEAKLNLMVMMYKNENKMRVSLEAKALDKEKALRIEIEEKEQLKREIIFLSTSLEEREKLTRETGSALTNKKEHFELVLQDLNKLKDHASQQHILISESNRVSDSIKGKLVDAWEQMNVYEVEISKLNQKLKMSMMEIREADEERKMLHGVIQEKQDNILSAEAKEREHKKKIESIIASVQGLSTQLLILNAE
ncbi:hypothetical protein HHK36_004845 [Tetracentron sinense]|uniref:WPP domain-associated protein n=1 Tax=Tetracentron sinense TaxID=13715 RepID=A0A834ZKL4_TETSI|nr:hypothetical protein HHK36_004845 [Tetracentron sinense]